MDYFQYLCLLTFTSGCSILIYFTLKKIDQNFEKKSELNKEMILGIEQHLLYVLCEIKNDIKELESKIALKDDKNKKR